MSFRIALSGLNAASSHLDVTANNIANVETVGFKSSRAEFADIFAVASTGTSSTATGAGARLASVQQQFSQGNIQFTDNNLDLAITGQGFFTLSGSEGLTYSRAGQFSVDKDGFVVNSQLQRLQVFPPIGDGSAFATGALNDLQLQTSESAPNATSQATLGLNLPASAPQPASAPFDPTVSSSFNHATSLTIYDSLGAAHTATSYFVKTPTANTWEQHLYIDGAAVGGANTLAFDSGGNLQTPAGGTITYPAFSPGSGAADLNLTFDFGNTTQFGQQFSVNNLSQDGFESGRLTGVEIDSRGVVSARFSNQQTEILGKVAMTGFTNPQGLQQLGNSSWAQTFASGEPRVGEAGTSNFGLLQSGALESSNVDLTAELVEMITAQRNFQANTQMISTADAVTQAIINMR